MAEHIKTIVDKYIKENKQKIKKYKNIKKILGKNLNKNTTNQIRIEFKENNKIVLFLKSSSAVYELRLQKKEIEENIKKEFSNIKEVKIEVE
jgi:divalent metal cation (Fe/Co/Zn/Cd) transporter